MSLIITLLTGVMVLDCLFLILLILMQLPKKEAGLGQAFGSGATDALFGAGSGSVLTKATKYAAGVFFGLAVLLTILSPRANSEKTRAKDLDAGLDQRPAKTQPATQVPSVPPVNSAAPAPTTPAPAVPAAPAAPAPASTNK